MSICIIWLLLANMTRIALKCRRDCPIECTVTTYDIDSAQTILGNKIVNEKVDKFFNTTKESTEYIQYVFSPIT